MDLNDLKIKVIEYDSPEYREAVKLRSKVLREPLNMKFTKEQLKAEFPYIHIAAFQQERMVGCFYIIINADQVRLKQFAVEQLLQKKGIGKALVRFAENFCMEKGAKYIFLHARDRAVTFYEKLGYECYDKKFLEIGLPHRKMRKILRRGNKHE